MMKGAAKALFFTAGFVHTDSGIVNHVASKTAQSPHYNSVLAVLDLQTGRSYIFNGRSDVGIHPQALAHINTYKKHGVKPIVIITKRLGCENPFGNNSKYRGVRGQLLISIRTREWYKR